MINISFIEIKKNGDDSFSAYFISSTRRHTEVVDIETSLPFLLDEDDFCDPARDVGFLLGYAKFRTKT
jgi:hypothetical protein